MTDPSGANLNRARVHRLLAAVGSAPAPVDTTSPAQLYDWRDPHYFNDDHRNRLAALMSQVAAVLAARCAHFFNSEFNVVPTSVTQHFAGDLGRQTNLGQGFSLAVGPDEEPACGFVAVGAAVAMDWVTQLLGDAESDGDADRSLSSLEESLLSNLIGAMADGFVAALRPHQNLKPADRVSRGPAAVTFEPTDPVCKIVFQIGKAQAEPSSEIVFILSAPVLAPAVGKTIATKATVPQDELARLLMEHVHQMPVSITARLGSMRLSFEEVLDLASGDVLLIDKPLDEPVDLTIHGQVVFRGRPAQSAGQYAVFITENATEAGPQDAR